jgi:ankyrin repeat protein
LEVNCGLHVAAYFGKTAMMEILLESLGDNVDLEWFGHTPIRLPVVEGHVDPVRVLSRVLIEANDDDANVTSIFHFGFLFIFLLYKTKQYVLITTNDTFHWNILSLL